MVHMFVLWYIVLDECFSSGTLSLRLQDLLRKKVELQYIGKVVHGHYVRTVFLLWYIVLAVVGFIEGKSSFTLHWDCGTWSICSLNVSPLVHCPCSCRIWSGKKFSYSTLGLWYMVHTFVECFSSGTLSLQQQDLVRKKVELQYIGIVVHGPYVR